MELNFKQAKFKDKHIFHLRKYETNLHKRHNWPHLIQLLTDYSSSFVNPTINR